jgi:hypothetical protein
MLPHNQPAGLAAAYPGKRPQAIRPRGNAGTGGYWPYAEISCKHEMYRTIGGKTAR